MQPSLRSRRSREKSRLLDSANERDSGKRNNLIYQFNLKCEIDPLLRIQHLCGIRSAELRQKSPRNHNYFFSRQTYFTLPVTLSLL